ncbi:MAG: hypothetical protein ACOY0T_20025 [Myxococcota bacterium]
MRKVLLGCALGLMGVVGVGCSSGDRASEVVASKSEALPNGLPIAGYYDKISGPFQFIEFTRRRVGGETSPFIFVARVLLGELTRELTGYYLETSSSVYLSPIEAPHPDLVQFFGEYQTSIIAPGALQLRQPPGGAGVEAVLFPTRAKMSSVYPPRIFLSAEPNAIEEYTAFELRKHLQLVVGGNVPIGQERSIFNAQDSFFGIYVGDTAFARTLNMGPERFSDEQYAIQTAGRSVVLTGRTQVQPGNVRWNVQPNEHSVRFDESRNEFAFEVAKDEQLFSTTGGTIELFLKDQATCSAADGTHCTYGDQLLALNAKTEDTFSITVQHQTDGAHLMLAFRNDGRRGPNPTYTGPPGHITIPRDGQVHHVTISLAKCSTSSSVCVTAWRDPAGAGTATRVWDRVVIPNSTTAILQVGSPWNHKLKVNRFRKEEAGSMFVGSLFGLRFAAKAATETEHRDRTAQSLIRPLADDRLSIPFSENGGAPADTAKPSRLVLPPIPSRWGNRGTLHAAHSFIENYLNVRWYMPGTLGTSYTRQSTVEVAPLALLLTNALRYREAGKTQWFTPPHAIKFGSLGEQFTQDDQHMFDLRMRLGGEDIPNGHGLNHLNVVNSTVEPQNPCYDNPAVINAVRAAAVKYYTESEAHYRASPEGQSMPMARDGTFVLGARDAHLFQGVGDCNYDSARARNRVDDTYPQTQYFTGRASNYAFDLYNQVALAARMAPRGNTSQISVLAYMDHTFPPDQPIESNILPVVAFLIRDFSGTSGQPVLSRWQQTIGPRRRVGWTYANDFALGLYPTPPFDAGQLKVNASSLPGLGLYGLKFEHNAAYDQVSSFADRVTFGRDIELFEAQPELRDNWPDSFARIWGDGPGRVMHCSATNPLQGDSTHRDWDAHCAHFNADPEATWDRLKHLRYSVFFPRGASYNLLENYVLMRSIWDPNISPITVINEHFDNFYGTAGSALKSLYETIAARPPERTFTQCPGAAQQTRAYYECVWPLRLPPSLITTLAGHITTARSKITASPPLTPVQAKRVNAFIRSVWCPIVRAYYHYYPNSQDYREDDVLNIGLACREDTTLVTLDESTNRFLME